jgi:ATP-dependent protease HslVU (ClpYQ) peptidase subunit
MIHFMTTLVGISGKDFVVMAADSQITEDNLRTISLLTPKIIEVNEYIIGITGDTRPGDVLTYNWNPPTYNGEDPVQWMGKKIIPSIIRAFETNGYDWAKQDKEGGFDYLIAFDGNLFHIACDMSFISNQEGRYGIGSGGQIALGYLYSLALSATKTLAASQAVARKAIDIASVLDVNTSPPVQLVVQERIFE